MIINIAFFKIYRKGENIMDEKKMMTPINNFNEASEPNEERDSWILCGLSDVCDDCNFICDPTYH